jgi:uncharacterized protein
MNNPVIFLQRDPLAGLTKDQFIQKLEESLHMRADECWIFGSFNTERFSKDSDVDIIIIHDTSIPFLMRAREYSDLYDLGPTLDLLVYTASEFKELLNNQTGFWKSVKETMVRIL